MNITDFITELFCQVDDALPDMAQHSQAILSLSELVTIGVLQAMKNVSQRAFYHWLRDNYGHLFPTCPTVPGSTADCGPSSTGPATSWPNPPCWAWPTATALNCATQCEKDDGLVKSARRASPTTAGSSVANCASYSTSWAWWPIGDCANGNVHDQAFQPLLACYDGQMIILADTGFHRAKACPWPEQGATQPTSKICRSWSVERPDDCGNCLFHDVGGVAHQGNAPSGLGWLRGSLGLHRGRLQYPRSMEWLATRRSRQNPSLHRSIHPLNTNRHQWLEQEQ